MKTDQTREYLIADYRRVSRLLADELMPEAEAKPLRDRLARIRELLEPAGTVTA